MLELGALTLKLLTMSWIIGKRQLIHDRTASRNSWEQSYDFIIVGAGTAGCTIAGRLSDNLNVKVLLLEAGGAQSAIYTDIPGLVYNISDKRPDLLNLYYSEPQKNAARQYPGGRSLASLGKMLGGTSSHNTMIFNRGNPRDYDNWAQKYGAIGWSYKEVLPFFKKYENNTDLNVVENNPGYHGTKGPVQITTPKERPQFFKLLQKSYNELGFKSRDFNAENDAGYMIYQQFVDANRFRSSAANAYVDPNPHLNNLHIVTKALVVKVLFKGLTAVGVEFAKNDKPFRVYARKEVILTAGAINTPKLMMLSGIGITEHLQKFRIPSVMDLPVGDNFQDHPQINFVSKIIESSSYYYQPPLLTVHQLSQLLHEKRGRLSEQPYIGLYFNARTNPQKEWPNAVLNSRIQFDTLAMTFFYARVRSRGSIRLQSRSPYVQPKIDPAFLADPLDFDGAVDAVRLVFKILEESSIAPFIIPPSFESMGCPVCPNKPRYDCIEGIKCYILYNTQTTWHPCCSVHMGAPNRTDVVVDPQLRVKNINQLRVCDASVFPEITNGNTNAPAFMVAEKCARLIMDRHNLG